MAEYLIQDITLENIGDKIRTLQGHQNQMSPTEMSLELEDFTNGLVEAINNLSNSKSDIGHTHTPAEAGADPAGSAEAVQNALSSHMANVSNPHKVTKGQVGLGNVDNTADIDKPVSTAQREAINAVDGNISTHNVSGTAHEDIRNSVAAAHAAANTAQQTADRKTEETDFQAHLADKKNPHNVTVEQIGAEPAGTVFEHNIDDDSHADIRNSVAEVTAKLNTFLDSDDITLDQLTEIVAYIKNNKTLIDGITTSKVNVSDIVDNLTTNIATKVLSAKQGVILKGEIDTLSDAVNNSIAAHLASTNNPHKVTKNQVGLGNVDNTTDLDKPVSTLQETFVLEKITEHNGDIVGTHADIRNLIAALQNSVSSNGAAIATKANSSDLTAHTGNTSNPHKVTAEQIGLGRVNNTPDTDKPVSEQQQIAINDAKQAGLDAAAALDTHKKDASNPHKVTKSQVGLSDVDNTSDVNKPVSTAQATAIADAKAAGTKAQTDLTAHIADTVKHITAEERSNWNSKAAGNHTHTAADVGAPTIEDVNEAIAAIPTPDVSGQINEHNTSTSAHSDIRTLISNIVDGTTTVGKATDATNAVNATKIYSDIHSQKIYVLGTSDSHDQQDYVTVARNKSVYMEGSVLYGAAWNDYAEYRISDCREAGRVICENGDDTLSLATERLQPGGNIISDTFGFAIGETEEAKTPIAVSGRVLAHTFEDRETFVPGDAVCAAPNGTVSKMTREEIMMYPERIIGTVSAIPQYKTWGERAVEVDNRIWVKVR